MPTRDDIKKVLDEGGTYLYKGQLIEHEGMMPSDAELAEGSGREAEVLEGIDSELKRLLEERDKLKSSIEKTKAAETAKAEKAAETKAAAAAKESEKKK